MPLTPGASYSLSVLVNEVDITFQALDQHNLPVTDLKPEEMDVFDNGSGPQKVLGLERLAGRPIHAALLVDTSGSVASRIPASRAQAKQAIDALLTRPDDQATIASFGRSRHIVKGWTHEKETLKESIDRVGGRQLELSDGTSLFDALYNTCFAQFGADATLHAVNVILLFSDGQDTASFATDSWKATDECRKNHVLIYAFNPQPAREASSKGESTLRGVIAATGGRFFHAGDTASNAADVGMMAADLRDGYLLLYRPGLMRADGSFHKVVVVGPARVASIAGTSGFYAPAR